MQGWRARVGLIVPHVNAVMEPEFNSYAPDGLGVYAARMSIPTLSADGLVAMRQNLTGALDSLAELGAAVTVFGCTSGSFVRGSDYDKTIIEEMAARTGQPAITTSTALRIAIRTIGARNVSVATPYSDELNRRLASFIEEDGVEVLSCRGLDLPARSPHYPLADTPVSHIGLQHPELVYRLARASFTEGSDALVVSCTNLNTLSVIDALEADLGVPVVTANQATFWLALHLARVQQPPGGPGSLLTHTPEWTL